jgi:glycine cleavage system aminomethyltransferase T
MAWGAVKEQDFVGREAHVSHRESEPVATLCTLTIDDHTKSGVKRYPLGREPVTTRDGTPLTDAKGRRSYVTSAGAGPSVGRHLVMSYLPSEYAAEGEQLAVRYMNELYPATVAVVGSRPIFDPGNARIRSRGSSSASSAFP